jgi:C_GCAxxG_C_C family probable redox protein
VGQEKLGAVNEEVVKALGAFGGGIAATGGTCGIVIGGVALASSMYSRGNLEGKEDPKMWSLGSEFTRKFAEMAKPYGGMNCRDIAGVDWRDREAVKKYYADPDSRRKICINLVGEAAYLLGTLLETKAKGCQEQSVS